MQKSYKKQLTIKLLWGFPLLFYAIDANAWGLYTHLFFSQWLLLSTPLLDPKIQQAIKKFPKLVLAGACLPDLAVVAKAFNSTHQWHKAEQMMQNAVTDEEIAIAVGYSSHLLHILAYREHSLWSNVNADSGTTWTRILLERERFLPFTRIGVHDGRT